MSSVSYPPLLIEPEQLQPCLADPAVLIVDLSDPARYAAGHIPGAIHLDYSDLIRVVPPAMGLLPDAMRLSEVLARIGLTPERHVIAYDAEGNGRASRLLWTLVTLGHPRVSLLNGGAHAWNAAGGLLEAQFQHPSSSTYQARFVDPPVAVADRAYILKRLGQPDVALLDTRTPAEYAGMDQRAARGGHIPGAVNLNWMDTMDPQRQLRLQPAPVLRQLLDLRGVTTDKEVIVYCQTHHRSAHTYWVLRYLGYPRVRGYPGAWSEWGNDPSVPVEA
ncbi:MAG: sulfurtransferase [Candidatus Competibacteraceae bacterium]|uniref:Sulfurtransferase n=1 Tax=Candidatus Contendobacter odensis Run_B_J11 TaxID=1400861 RepID=A0A7U7GFS4_9GAMM|nr:sulfurtransferase [Candidatus Contendobacter odensis]MBK8534246.1 sulfurtransferase [Candidatus Competibacteraceae bacterium]MBK8751977.1 sulfurtransferase [Candidatus Competibacteraceae bacterium]CDH47589.1 Thiosulfate sulfurtransferase [Candidatus Contendobacter odensis Run_B_J11]